MGGINHPQLPGGPVSPSSGSSARRAARHNGAALGACASGAGPLGCQWPVTRAEMGRFTIQLEFHRILLIGISKISDIINKIRVLEWFWMVFVCFHAKDLRIQGELTPNRKGWKVLFLPEMMIFFGFHSDF